ncbi:MAG: glycoside/pentoside/hexuronide:cation symporter, family [Gammaproteobacteria bacterium]|jgi:Na+/melibiose symporter-like transporter|nr:glycoside/pentoside/hexuronide:cation symporter, family [Gammaproteobacteria bacterium]
MNWRQVWPQGARIDAGKLGWATGELGLASYTAVSSIYLLFYATDVLRIPPTWAGLALLIPRIWNIVGDPIVGFVSDRTHTRFGRRRPYLLGGALVWGAAFFLLFNLPVVNDSFLQTMLFGSVFLLNNTGLTLYQVPYSAMLAELTSDSAERTKLVAYKEVAARAAVLLTLLGAPLLLARAASPAAGFSTIGATFAALFVGSGLVAFFATARSPATASPTHHGRLTLQIAPLLENRPFAFVTLAFLFVNLADAVFSGTLVYYVTKVMHRNAALIGVLYPVGSVTGILCTPLWALAANRFGKTLACRVALAMNALCCLLPLLFPAGVSWLMYPFMCLYGLFNTGARLLPSAMVPDTVELDQQRTGERREGVMFGLFVFVQQTGFAAGGFVISLLLAVVGVGSAAHADSEIGGIVVCFTIAAGALYGLAFFCILGYRLNRNPVEPFATEQK